MEQKKGVLYGVGVGPGDPDLMTLKAVKAIQESDVIAVPKSSRNKENLVAFEIARQVVPGIEQKPLLPISMPMTRDAKVLKESHEQGASDIGKLLNEGKTVSFLTLGDPSVYSTYIYVHNILIAQGYDARIIPGVTSFCAVAACLGDGLVETSTPLHVIPASYPGTEEALDWKGTKVLMKMGKSVGQVRELLDSKGLLDRAKMVQNCGMENERVWHTLAGSEGEGEEPGYFSLIVIK